MVFLETVTWKQQDLLTVCVCVMCFQPLLTRKNELDKLRKEVKEQWQREQKKMVSGLTQRGSPDTLYHLGQEIIAGGVENVQMLFMQSAQHHLWNFIHVSVCMNLVYLHLQHEADSALKKARLLQAQRHEEYEKAKVSTSRLEEEQIGGGGGAAAAKQLEKRRRLEEEALQKVHDHLIGLWLF